MIPCCRNSILKTIMIVLVATLTLGLTSTALAQGILVSGVAPDGEPGGFGIDGNLLSNSPGGTIFSAASDWVAGPAGIGVGKLLCPSGTPIDATKTFHVIDLTKNDDLDVFAESDKVEDDPNTYNWKAGSVPQKDDINNGLIHLSTDLSGDLWVMMAGDRRATNGDSYIDFEFLQNTLTKNADGSFTSLGPDGGRTVGDILLTIHLIRGGAVAELFAQKWLSDGMGGFNYFDFVPAAGDAFVAANVDSVVNVCYGAFGSTTYDVNAFGEAAANISNLVTAFDPCFGIATLWIRTKSSQSFTAQLKDMIEPIQLNLCLDVEPPVITCPSNKVFDCVMGNAGTATATDNCELDTIFFEDDTTSSRCPIRIERSWIAVDACGNADTCVQTITIQDITPPVLTFCPADDSVECPATPVFGHPTFVDACGPVTLDSADETTPGRCPNEFSVTRTWHATDACGNVSAPCSQTIKVKDTTKPTIKCAGNKTIECGAAVIFDNPTASDICDPLPDINVVANLVTPGPGFGETTYTKTWQAVDDCGNLSVTCSQSILKEACPTGKITPTQTTCSDFVNGTAGDLTDACYGVKSGVINNAAPGVFFYFTQVTAPSSSFTVDIVQTKNNGSFPFFAVHNGEVRLFNSSCTQIGSGTEISLGQVSVNISGATVGQAFIISVKYSVNSVVGTPVSSPFPTVHYDFRTEIGGITVDLDPDGLDLGNKPPCVVAAAAASVENASSKLELHANHPNPFNANTTIKYSLPTDGKVTIAVYNILGQRVITLVDAVKSAGYHTVIWNGKNASGNDIASGVYFYRIQFGNETQIKRMTLLK